MQQTRDESSARECACIVAKEDIGVCLGRGIHRSVHEHATRRDLVVKVALAGHADFNRQERDCWRILQRHAAPEVLAYFCPVVAVSDDCQYLLMRRADCASRSLIASFPVLAAPLKRARLCDVSPQNVGLIDNKPVLVDYHYLTFRQYRRTKDTNDDSSGVFHFANRVRTIAK